MNDMRSDWQGGAWIPEVMDRLQPSNSTMSFASQARQIMGPVQHEWLRRALDVTLEDDPAHPMEPGRIDALNAYLHAAARRLLDIPVVDEASLNDQLDTLSADIADVPVLRNEALLG